MPILGAREGDIRNCLFGNDKDACRRVYFGYYLWPRLQKVLDKLELIRTPIPQGPWPEPDPKEWSVQELMPLLLARHFGDTDPKPNLPLELRLETTMKFRDGMKELTKELDQEIKELEQRIAATG